MSGHKRKRTKGSLGGRNGSVMFCIAATIHLLHVFRFQHDDFLPSHRPHDGGVSTGIDLFLAHEFPGMFNAGWSYLIVGVGRIVLG